MNAKVHDLMTENVILAQPHQTVEHVRKMLDKSRISAVPVVDTEGQPVGIVSLADLKTDTKNGTPVRCVMTEKIYTVPQYDDVHVAARIMRNHRIHHVVVTHEQRVVGMLSAFDLLRLVEDRRFVSKAAPTAPARKRSKHR